MEPAGRRSSPWERWGWRLPSDRWWPGLSGRGSSGIGGDVACHCSALTRMTSRAADAAALAVAFVAVVTGAAGCGLRGLAHDQLYGSPDAGRMPDVAGPDEQGDARADGDAAAADASDDAGADGSTDAADTLDPPDAGGADLAGDTAGEGGDASPP